MLKESLIFKKTNFKRSILELMVDILSELKEENLIKTHVTFRCKLDSRVTTKYMTSLTQLGFITRDDEGAKFYNITNEGRTFLEKYDDLIKLLSPNCISDEDFNLERPII